MIITVLSGPMKDSHMNILYLNEADCIAALGVVSGTLRYDHNLQCVVSDTPSGSMRPVKRP